MRSVWKPDYFSKKVLKVKDVSKPVKIYDKFSTIPENFVNKRVLIHNGKRLISLLIRDFHVGRKFSSFIICKSTGAKIHVSKKKTKKSSKK